MTDQWTARLSEYVDGELEPDAQAGLEAHLVTCPACARVLAELEAVRAQAASLEDRPPARDLWPGIAARLGRAGRQAAVARRPLWRRRLAVSVPQLAAAALLLAAVSAGGAWLALDRGGAGPTAAGGAVAPGPETVRAALVGGPDYDRAVADLVELVARHRDALDTATVRMLEESLATIDRAIADARAALAADPANPYLNGYLAETLRRKLELLRRTARIATAAS